MLAGNETQQRNTILSEEITTRKLITKKLEQAIQQEARRIAEEARVEQLRIERARQAEEQRIEQESKAEQRRATQERTRTAQERRRVEQAINEERRQVERQRQTRRRLEIIRAERERLSEQRQPPPSLYQTRTEMSLPEQPHLSTDQLLTQTERLHRSAQPQPVGQSELSDDGDLGTQMQRVERAEKHAQDNNCTRMLLVGDDGSSIVEVFFPSTRYNDYKATFLVPRIGLELYRYLTSFEDASKPTCNICLDASGSFGCGRNSGGKNCEGALCWECFHTFFVEDSACPLCRLEYIPLGKRGKSIQASASSVP
jgi:hypothetical protein